MKKSLSIILALVMIIGLMTPAAYAAEVNRQELFEALKARFSKVANIDDITDMLLILGTVEDNSEEIFNSLPHQDYLQAKGLDHTIIGKILNTLIDSSVLELMQNPDIEYEEAREVVEGLLLDLFALLPADVKESIERYAATREEKIDVMVNVLDTFLNDKIGGGVYNTVTNEWTSLHLFVRQAQINKLNKTITEAQDRPFKKLHLEIINKSLEEAANVLAKEGYINEAGDLLHKLALMDKLETDLIFADMQNHWSKKYVEFLSAKNIINGYEDGTFRPNNEITRAEFAKMIVMALELDLVKYNGEFSDIKATDWHADYVATIVDAGLAQGYGDTTFRPNNKISRAEMAVILGNVLDIEVEADEIDGLFNKFEDLADLPDWAKLGVAKVIKDGIMIGSNNKFNPNGRTTRAEVATAVYRLINR